MTRLACLLALMLPPAHMTGLRAAAPNQPAGLDLEALPGELPPPIEEETLPGARLRLLGGESFVFDSPAAVARIPGSPGWVVIAMQRGELWCAHPESGEKRLFLDFRKRMQGVILFEEGVHGIAFHPQFLGNGLFYLSYTQNDPRRSLLVEMAVKPGYLKHGPVEADPASERLLLEVPQPLAEHWGGCLAFDASGCLLYGLGDGGLRNDPYRLAQNPWSLHGKILRLDVDQRSGALPYGIPKDNPFADDQLARSEIYALGLRNPWGMHLDPQTKELWCADVGQDFWEEINLIFPGGNYGWSDRDGYWPLPAHAGANQLHPGFAETIDPVHAYTRLRAEGLCIIGGFVYRGKKMPALQGHYLFADWAMGRVWALEVARENGGVRAVRRLLIHDRAGNESFNPTVIAPDADGEPLVLSQNGAVYAIEVP